MRNALKCVLMKSDVRFNWIIKKILVRTKKIQKPYILWDPIIYRLFKKELSAKLLVQIQSVLILSQLHETNFNPSGD
jgi:hypothetical protein